MSKRILKKHFLFMEVTTDMPGLTQFK